MSNLQNNLSAIKDTVSNLKSVINEISESNGNGPVISSCTKFEDYPKILKSVYLGSSGLATLFAYKISDVNPGIPEDTGNFDFNTNTYSVPLNWNKADDLNATESDTVGMTQAMFAKSSNNESNIIESGSKPVRISSFTTPSSIVNTQTVYLQTEDETIPLNRPIPGDGDNPLHENSKGVVKYPGLSSTFKCVGVSSREKLNGVWSSYSTPVLYSRYGEDGKTGTAGVITRTIFAFTSTSSREEIPEKPVGGKGDIESNDVIFPDGGTESPETTDNKKYSGMSTSVVTSNNNDNLEGSEPSCITGEDGINGTDGVNSEFIYALLPNVGDLDEFVTFFNSNNGVLETSDTNTVPNFILNGYFEGTSIVVKRTDKSEFTIQLTDSPSGIDAINNKIEIYGTRRKSDTSGNNGVGPMMGSVGGENGMDGDGVEYIFTVSDDSTCDVPLPIYRDLPDEEKEKFQKREYVPEGGFDNDDDGGGIGPDIPYLFCSMRKQYTDENGNHLGGDFSTPTIWGHGGKDGIGAYTSFAFCISKNDISKYTITGGQYTNSLNNLITKNEIGDVIEFEGSDTVPRVPNFDETIGMINKFFNGSSDEESKEGFGPTKMSDSEHFQVEFNCQTDDEKSKYDGRKLISLEEFKIIKESESPSVIYSTINELETAGREYVYNNGYGNGADSGKNAIYMATARFVNNKGEDWVVNKIKGESGDSYQFIFKLTDGSTPDNPTPEDIATSYQNDSYKPVGGELDPQSVSDDRPVCWISQRNKHEGTGSSYSDPAKGSMYAKGNVHLELSEDYINVPCNPDNSIDQDYDSHIVVRLLVYDNGTKVDDVTYEALINDDTDDYKISNVLKEVPTNAITSGFFNDKLYIGKEFLSRYKDDLKLRVECKAIYKNIPYTKAFIINKSTNTYELNLSQDILYLDKNGFVKNNILQVDVSKGVEDRFKLQASGYIEGIITFKDDSAQSFGKYINVYDYIDIDLSSYKDIQSVKINYRLEPTSDVLTYEVIGTIIDGKDGITPVNKFLSQVFCRTNADISNKAGAPTGGTYDNPIPNDSTVPDKIDKNESNILDGHTTGTDGIPPYDPKYPKQIGMSSKGFYSDGSADGTKASGTTPMLIQDTNEVEVGGCDEDVSNPGKPDAPLNGASWYDGDTVGGVQATKNPIWMATQRLFNGARSEGVVTRVKGEKGDPGKDGADGTDGVNGGFGPMARYGIGTSGNQYYSRDDNQQWYDIVEYNGSYYLCEEQHTASVSNRPDKNTSHGTKSEHFEFVTADTAAIRTIVSESIQANKVSSDVFQTKSSDNGPGIKLEDGTLKVFPTQNKGECPSVVFGISESGLPRIEFGKDCNTLAYVIGPDNGYEDLTQKEYNGGGTPETVYKRNNLSSTTNTNLIIQMIEEDFMYDSSGSMIKSISPKIHTINGVAQSDSGLYYTDVGTASQPSLTNGTYTNSRIGLGLTSSVDGDKVEGGKDAFNAFNEKYNDVANLDVFGTLYTTVIRHFSSGNEVFTERVFGVHPA